MITHHGLWNDNKPNVVHDVDSDAFERQSVCFFKSMSIIFNHLYHRSVNNFETAI